MASLVPYSTEDQPTDFPSSDPAATSAVLTTTHFQPGGYKAPTLIHVPVSAGRETVALTEAADRVVVMVGNEPEGSGKKCFFSRIDFAQRTIKTRQYDDRDSIPSVASICALPDGRVAVTGYYDGRLALAILAEDGRAEMCRSDFTKYWSWGQAVRFFEPNGIVIFGKVGSTFAHMGSNALLVLYDARLGSWEAFETERVSDSFFHIAPALYGGSVRVATSMSMDVDVLEATSTCLQRVCAWQPSDGCALLGGVGAQMLGYSWRKGELSAYELSCGRFLWKTPVCARGDEIEIVPFTDERVAVLVHPRGEPTALSRVLLLNRDGMLAKDLTDPVVSSMEGAAIAATLGTRSLGLLLVFEHDGGLQLAAVPVPSS